MKQRLLHYSIALLAVLAMGMPLAIPASAAPNAAPSETKSLDDVFTADRTDWYRDARFGMFIHLGPYSKYEGHYGSCQSGEWIKHDCNVPWDDYEAKAAAFKPESFDADAIVAAAKAAGQKYIVFTSKHHDGFAMWDTAVNDWNIHDRSGFNRDLMAELKVAAEAAGIKFGVYYSTWDWHDPDAQPDSANPDAYVTRMKAQLSELQERYQPSLFWFDGEWEQPWNAQRGDDLENYMREIAPTAIINNRVGTRQPSDGDYGTPEQTIPSSPVDGQLWETCMTIPKQWGYASWDTDFKSSKTLTRSLLNIAGNSGNFLLNIGPKPDGTMVAAETQRLGEMGEWIHASGHDKAVYGNEYTALVAKPSWGFVSRAGNKLYAAVTEWPVAGGSLHMETEQPLTITGARVLGSNQSVTVTPVAGGLDIAPSGGATNDIATVIEFDLQATAASPVGTGIGLKANYWAQPGWQGSPAVTRTDPTINFNWNTLGSPAPGIPARSFSSRWTGQIEPRFTEEYTFITVGAATLRVVIDGKPVTNDGGMATGKIRLEAGRRYDIWAEQTSTNAGAVAKLLWRSPNTPQQIVPSTQLYPVDVAAINDTDPAVGYSHGDWTHAAQRRMGDFQDDVHYATRDGASASYTFTGTGVGIVTERNADQGLLDVYLDGVLAGTVNTFAQAREAQVEVFSERDLAPGQHTLKVVKRSGEYAVLDRIDVYNKPLLPLALTMSAESKCVGSKSFVAVRVQNDELTPVNLKIQTAYGEKSFTGVQPGTNAYHVFAVRTGSVQAGTARVEATGTGNKAAVTLTKTVAYDAKNCA